MARNTGAINRVFDLFRLGTQESPVRVTTSELNSAAQGDGTRRYRDLVANGELTEVSRRTLLPSRQVEYSAY